MKNFYQNCTNSLLTIKEFFDLFWKPKVLVVPLLVLLMALPQVVWGQCVVTASWDYLGSDMSNGSNPNCNAGNGQYVISFTDNGDPLCSGMYEVLLEGGNSAFPELPIGSVITVPFSVQVNQVKAGLYTIVLRDTDGGEVFITTVNLLSSTGTTCPPDCEIIINSTGATDESCGGGNDGSLNITANSGGNDGCDGPLEYSINGIDFQPSSSFSGLSPGSYSIVVRCSDNTVCLAGATAIIEPGTGPCCEASLTTCPTAQTITCAQANTFADNAAGLFALLGGNIDIAPAGCGVLTISDNFTSSAVPCGGDFMITFSAMFTPTGESAQVVDLSSCNFPITVTVSPPAAITSFPDQVANTVDCGGLPTLPNTFTVSSGSSPCERTATMTLADYSSQMPYPCGPTGGTVTLTWSGTDNCGAVLEHTEIVTVNAATAPADFACPNFGDLTCDQALTFSTPTITQNNGLAAPCSRTLTAVPTLIPNYDECGGTLTVRYTITETCSTGSTTDDCVITVTAAADPTITVPDLPATLNCVQAAAFVPALASYDNGGTGVCEIAGNITGTVSYTANAVCTANEVGVVTVTYSIPIGVLCTEGTVTDEVVMIPVVDTEAPEVLNCPADMTMNVDGTNCDATVKLIPPIATDNCDGVITTTFTVDGAPSTAVELIIPAGESRTVAYTFTDACGNANTDCSFTITIVDNDNPVIICPPNLTICAIDGTCTWAATGLALVNAIEDCGYTTTHTIASADASIDVTDATGDVTDGTLFPLGTSTITYTITEDLAPMNTATCSFTVIVEDCEAPMITNCPADVTAAVCTDALPAAFDPAMVMATDFCDENATIAVTRTVFAEVAGCGATKTTIYVFLATDAAGNTSECYASITVVDDTAPTFDVSNEGPISCASDDPAAWAATAVTNIMDECSGTTTTTTFALIDYQSTCPNEAVYTYSFTVTDECGNAATQTATYTVEDAVDPTITVSAVDLNLTCDGTSPSSAILAWLNNNGGATAMDNCGPVTWSNSYNGITFTCGTVGSASVTFTATDQCGRTTATTATINITDVTAPTISCPDNIILECGNQNNLAIIEGWLASVSASDACSAVTVTNDFIPANPLPACESGANVLMVTFTVAGNCDATDPPVTCTATITIEDNNKPVIMVPPVDLYVECGADNATAISNWVDANGNTMAVDDCETTLTETFVAGTAIAGTCGTTSVTPYTYTADDGCGNTVSAIAYLHVVDTQAPIVIPPVPASAICTAPALSTWLAGEMANDMCDAAPAIYHSLLNHEISCNGTTTQEVYTYIFYAVDDCGNVSPSLTSTYTLFDNVPPSITAPTNLNVACSDDIGILVLDWLDNYMISDNCGNESDLIVTNNFTGIPNSIACGGNVDVMWTVTDNCGSSSQATASIVVAPDITAPVFSNCPFNMIVTTDIDLCNSYVNFVTPIATDCNGPVMVSQQQGPASGTLFPVGTTLISFEATDNCSNTSTCSFLVTVIDSDIPTLNCPSNDVVVCMDADVCTWLPDASIAPTIIENCPTVNYTYMVTGATTVALQAWPPVAATPFNKGTSTVTYNVTDAAGNMTSCSFNVIVEDCQLPTFTCPTDMTVECGPTNAASLTTWLATVLSEADNCTTDLVVNEPYVVNSISACGGGSTEVYMFSVTDCGDNTTTCTASFTIEDTTAPVIANTTPLSTTVDCDGTGNTGELLAWITSNGGIPDANVTEVCGTFTWQNDYSTASLTNFAPGCNNSNLTGRYDVNFWVVDECGLVSNMIAKRFRILDNTPPVITNCPSALTLECNDVSNPGVLNAWLNTFAATDLCDNSLALTNDYDGSLPACAASEAIIFTATDACGNTATCMVNISVSDTEKPVIMVPPSDLTLECDGTTDPDGAIAAWLLTNGGMMAVDQCTTIIVANAVGTAIDLCGGTSSTPYTFTATDACGNSISEVAYIHIVDTTDPIFTVAADPGPIACDVADPGAWAATALTVTTETCSGTMTDYALVNIDYTCGDDAAVYTYIFTVTDDCGNVSTANGTYTTVDMTVPTITAPADLMLACGDDVANLIAAWIDITATDNCDDDVQVTNDFDGMTNLCGGTVMVTWTATDDCSNATNVTANIVVAPDLTGPTWIDCPGDMNVGTDVDNCDAFVIFSTPIAEDCNDGLAAITQVANTAGVLLSSGDLFPLGVTEIVFQATDACGNVSTCSFNITVVDTDDPVILCPSNTVEACATAGGCVWIADNSVAATYAVENCPNYTVSYTINGVAGTGTTAVGQTFQLGTSTVTYTITDATGTMVATCSFVVDVKDCEAPTINCTDELNVACADENVSTWINTIVATASDICDPEVSVSTLLLTDISSCGGTIEQTYLFTVTDDAGNTTTCTATYETDDAVPPTIITAATSPEVDCNGEGNATEFLGWLNDNGGADATDACSGPVTWSNNYDLTGDDLEINCGLTGFVDVIFTATDDCGNTATSEGTFTIVDTDAPDLVVPASIQLECENTNNAAIIAAWLGTANAEDICDYNVIITNDYVATTDEDACLPAGGSSIVVIFTATDDCDNTSTDVATITFVDNTPPEIVAEAQNIEDECPADDIAFLAWFNGQGGASAIDGCDEELMSLAPVTLSTTFPCPGSSITTVQFGFQDECGNQVFTTATYTVTDETAPVLTLPSNVTVECNNPSISLTDWLNTFSSTDVCFDEGVIESNVLWNTISGCGTTMTETYLFTATDACGNASTGLATYTITDTEDPIIDFCPEPLALECGDPNNSLLILNWLNSATASDLNGCSGVTITHDYTDELPSLACTGVDPIIVTFVATDECGNSSQCVSSISRNDTVNPFFLNCPADLIVNVDVDLCETNVVYSVPVAQDDCDNEVTVVMMEGIAPGAPFPLGTTTLIYIATDDCENTASCEFTITVVDSDIPTILCPSNDVVQCNDAGVCTWLSDESVSPSYSIENCLGYVVTYVITNPDGTTVNSAVTGINDVADDAYVFSLGTSVVCYTITDGSDNTSSCCFNVVVEDCEAPMITCPLDELVECNGTGNTTELASWLAEVTGSDNCDLLVDLTFDNVVWNTSSACGGGSTTTYLFTVTDQAGNATTCLADFTIQDTTDPVIDTPAAPLTVECSDANNSAALTGWLLNNAGALASDVCSDLTWSNNYGSTGIALSDDCAETGAVTVTFTATDDCGNTTATTATFTIEDTTNPTWELAPLDLVIECDGTTDPDGAIAAWLSNVGGGDAEDLCSGLSYMNNYVAGDANTGSCSTWTGSTVVTFTATDACDNLTTITATVTIEDTTAPDITCPPAITLECNEALPVAYTSPAEFIGAGGTISDDCSTASEFTLAVISTVSNGKTICPDDGMLIYTRTYQITDACGNVSYCTQDLMYMEDLTAPELTAPEDEVVECNDATITVADWIAEATATDFCTADEDINITAVLWNTIEGCGGTYTEVYLFTATDDCGNASTALASYEIEDTTAPTPACPEPLVLECGDEDNDLLILAWLTSASATDAFDCSDVTVAHDFTDGLPELACLGGQPILVTFTATDDCGNSATCTSTISMDDTINPFFLNCPADLIVNVDVDLCETNVVYSVPVAHDACDNDVSVVMTEGIVPGAPFPLGVTNLVYTATDDCGNTASCEFTITVVDSDIPTILCPSNDVVQCNDAGVCTWLSDESVSASYSIENCPGYVVTYVITNPDGTTVNSATTGINDVTDDAYVFSLGTSVVCYTITDGATNTSSCCFNVVVEDCEAPMIICPMDEVVECNGTGNTTELASWLAEVTGSDNCDLLADLTFDNVVWNTSSACGGGSTTTYLFTVTDQAGNATTCLADFTIQDTTDPVIDTPAAPLTVECSDANNSAALTGWLLNNGGAIASDICSDLTWSNNFGTTGIVLSDLCGETGAVTVTFTATDACDNTTATTATFTIEDTTDPTWELAPLDLVIECDGSTDPDGAIAAWLSNVGGGDAEDLCSGVTYSNSYTVGDANTGACSTWTGSTVVTFTATDACNNMTTITATVTIEDTTIPDITCPPAIMLVCNEELPAAYTTPAQFIAAGGTIADDCSTASEFTLALISEVDNGKTICPDDGMLIYTRTYGVTDACGNTAYCTQDIMYEEDLTAPALTAPDDVVVECADPTEITVAEWIALATATDFCTADEDIVIEAVLWNTISACGGTSTEVYLFTATDDCGNASTALASYETIDTTDPSIDTPAADMTVECNDANNSAALTGWLATNGGAAASDDCSDLTWSNNYGSTGGILTNECGTTGSVTVIFTVTDDCGNASSTTATFTIEDTTPPVWTINPIDLVVECDASVDPAGAIGAWLSIQGQGYAEDLCAAITFSNDYTVGDANTGGCSVWTGSTVVTFTATDECTNFTTVTATVTIVDTTAPDIVCPPTISLTCGEDLPIPYITYEAFILAGGTITDDCSVVANGDGFIVALLSEIDNDKTICPDDGELTYTRTYVVTDACGNTSTCTQDIIYEEDLTAPTIDVVASNETVDCDATGNPAVLTAWLNDNGGAEASDDCSATLTWEYDLVSELDMCGNTATYTYRFTVSDECGNTATTEANFIVEDTTAPALADGVNVVEECDDFGGNNDVELQAWLAANGGWNATDACSDAINWSNDFDPITSWTEACGNTGIYTVSFTATDDCGNSMTGTSTFTITDMTAPVFTNCPEPEVIVDAPIGWCAAFANFSLPLAIDNCSYPTVTQIDGTGLTSGSLFPVGTTILTWEAEDECGNTSQCTRKVIVNDYHTPPEIFCPTVDTVFNDPMMCGAIVNNIEPDSVYDNCPNHAVITYSITNSAGDLLECGFEDASGYKFPVGTSTVEYTIQDQPLMLITEINQSGAVDQIEITNFGPADMNISCLVISRVASNPAADQTIVVPAGTIIPSGGVWVQDLAFDGGAGMPACYAITYGNNNIDQVCVNGLAGIDFTGTLAGGDVYRTIICDTNDAADWLVVDACNPANIGTLNPGLTTMTANGTMTSLQSEAASAGSCSFDVVVIDDEAPFCAIHDTLEYTIATLPAPLAGCTNVTLTVPINYTVGDVNIVNLAGTYPNMGDLSFKLSSPSGTTVNLFGGLCNGMPDFNLGLDDQATSPVAGAPCGPLGGGASYIPMGSLKDFFGESSLGIWTLEVTSSSVASGTIDNFVLEVNELSPYVPVDTILNNDAGLCSADYTWQHPLVGDNCCLGIIMVDYTSDDNIAVPTGGMVTGGSITTQTFGVGTTTVTYTLIDQSGNVGTCSFTVTVLDVELPVLVCPDDIVVGLDGGECEQAVYFPLDATDNCSVDSIWSVPSAGSFFEIGVHGVTIYAQDASGNLDSCSFTITVEEYPDPITTLSCNIGINLSLDATCTACITPDMILEGGPYGCYDDYVVMVLDCYDPDCDPIATSPCVGLEHVGDTLAVKIIDPETGVACWGYIFIEDKLIPEIDCAPDTTIACTSSWEPEVTGFPELLTCELSTTTEYTDEFIDLGCNDPRAQVIRTWTVTDDSDNAVTCVQTISIQKSSLESVEWPLDRDNIVGTALYCADVVNDPTLTDPDNEGGWPSINGMQVVPGGLCDMAIGFEDQILEVCAGSTNTFEILRTWTVKDNCLAISDDNPITHLQSIKVLDTIPPVIDCANPIEVSVTNTNCIFPFDPVANGPSITDECSGVANLTYVSSAGTFDLPAGAHTVTYIAEDGCGNISSCTVNVTVGDSQPPVAICETTHTVDLSTPQPTLVWALTFDDGSYDACGPITMDVRRMDSCIDYDWTTDGAGIDFLPNGVVNDADQGTGNPNSQTAGWYPAVPFSCCDVGTEVMVAFRVTDIDGNRNTCMVTVIVEDMIEGVISCPANQTFDCTADIAETSDIDLEGVSTTNNGGVPAFYYNEETGNWDNVGYYGNGFDNCGANVFILDRGGINNCGESYLVNEDLPGAFRRYYAIYSGNVTNPSSNWSVFVSEADEFCTQLNLVENNNAFDESDITWPNDVTITCPVDPTNTGTPTVSEDACSQVVLTSEPDILLPLNGDTACYKILRTWLVIDWCAYTGDPSGPGYWSHEQVIKVQDTEDPVITSTCTDVSFDINTDNNGDPNDGCFAAVSLSADAIDNCVNQNALVWSWTIDADNNGTVDLSGSGDSLSGNYPLGTHSITWTVEDGCGNIAQCSYLFHVEDNTPPLVYADNGLEINLVNQGGGVAIATLWASDFDEGSTDECSGICDMRIASPSQGPGQTVPPTTSSVVFDCSTLGQETVDFWVKDCSNNWSYVSTFVIVQDNDNSCTNVEMASISGAINTEVGDAVEYVTVDLVGGSMNSSMVTGNDGLYAFDNLPLDENYNVTPERLDNPLNGVSTYDLVIISKHILSLQLLDSPYKMIAADINKSGTITTFDMVQLRKLILFIDTAFVDNTSWRFVDADFVFPDPTDPFGTTFPEMFNVNGLTQNELGNFVGVKIGDVTGNVTANDLMGGEDRTMIGDLIFRADDQRVAAEEVFTVDFTVEEFEAAGYQFTMKFDEELMELQDVIPGNLDQLSEGNFGLSKLSEGVITTSWNKADGVKLRDGSLVFSLTFKAKRDLLLSEALSVGSTYTVAEAYTKDLGLLNIDFRFNSDEEVQADRFYLYQNLPNPFKDETVISFTLPETVRATLEIYDVSGRVLKVIEQDFVKGYNEVTIERNDLNGSGMVYYQLTTPNHTATRKMMIVK